MPVTPEVVEDEGNYSKVATGQWRTIKFAVSLDRSCDQAFSTRSQAPRHRSDRGNRLYVTLPRSAMAGP
jgi:hypothetical protein